MQAIQPYLFFNGNCREAMEFYAKALRGELKMQTYAQGPGAGMNSSEANRVMHADLTTPDNVTILASDAPPGDTVSEGKNISLCIHCASREEEERIFAALSEGGEVRMPLQDTFWGAHFGMLQDRFGVGWMLSLADGQAHP